ncbi:arginase [Longispora fulva]|uniref:Arginase n=1 Tax=Longispora fulva TaxID=619741 RepID=A0A8J7GN87_9ACTN|nr:arginase family protein [Longispora fulva]MBG6140905.1 arginase [Longispora fulva]
MPPGPSDDPSTARRIAVLDAPSNLGLRPPTIGSVPGCGKAPGALRDARIVDRLKAYDAGCVTPPRYDPGEWRPGDGVAQAGSVAVYSKMLAARIGDLLDREYFPVVLGGDCSITLGVALALRRRSLSLAAEQAAHAAREAARVAEAETDPERYAAEVAAAVRATVLPPQLPEGPRYGLVYLDGHSDFRHEGNAPFVGAAAGENLALATGRGQLALTDIDDLKPYLHDQDVVVLGIRQHDEHRMDLRAAGIEHRTVPALRAEGASRSAAWAREVLADCAGYWVHVDVDILDPSVMPAVDAPDPGGIAYGELELLIAGLTDAPECLGLHISVFDPDYDPTGTYAEELVQLLVNGLGV